MVSRRKKAKAKTTAAGVKGKNTTEMKDGAGDDTGGEVRGDDEHVTPKEATMSFQSTDKVPGESYFRRLPLEVRQMIYASAVVEDDPIQPVQVEARANKFQGSRTAAKAFTSLLLTCREFYEELLSRPYFFRDNTFKFESYFRLTTFLAALSPARRSMIRKIEYTAEFNYRLTKFLQPTTTLLSHCTSFQSLSIIIPIYPNLQSFLHPPETLLAIMLQYPMETLQIRPDGNDWRRLRTASVLRFQISIWAYYEGKPPKVLLSGLGVSADHGNLELSGEHGFIDTNAAVVREAQRLNTRILEMGTHCSPKYAIDKPITGSRLQEALIRSKLDVHGDDRVHQSHQSGIVSRGTRSRTLRARQVSSNGVLPEAAQNPKYIDIYEDEDEIVEA